MLTWPFTHLLSACLLSCNRVATSPLQIVPEWPPVACKLYLCGRQSHAHFGRFYSCCMWLTAKRVQLHATGGHSGKIYMRLATSCMQILHALAASCVQSRQLFASTLREQLFEIENEDAIKNLRIYSIHVLAIGLSINTLHDPIQSPETVPLRSLGIAASMAESISWNRVLGSLNVYKLGLFCVET
jgi:hypothetical protein